ncbi:MAG: hypothetical protein HY784_10925 [Chloroflexi bacterium]|nr:hypothetical protein [Chloroflexota bacterium]
MNPPPARAPRDPDRPARQPAGWYRWLPIVFVVLALTLLAVLVIVGLAIIGGG